VGTVVLIYKIIHLGGSQMNFQAGEDMCKYLAGCEVVIASRMFSVACLLIISLIINIRLKILPRIRTGLLARNLLKIRTKISMERMLVSVGLSGSEKLSP
jgi:hypothetical protein